MSEPSFSVKMKLLENYIFQIDFGDFGNIITDEPSPMGSDEGPNPVRLLAASVANCLAASLLFAIRKYKQEPGEVSAEVTGQTERVDGRWRVTSMAVHLKLGNKADSIDKLQDALNKFEDFCVVTQSVRAGIPVEVSVEDSEGKALTIG